MGVVWVYVCCLSRSGTMLEGYSPVGQALLGTLFTWGLTAAGAALVFVFSSRQVMKAEPTCMQSLSKHTLKKKIFAILANTPSLCLGKI